jgi:hypothetical protein
MPGKAPGYVTCDMESTDAIVNCFLMREREVLLSMLDPPKQVDTILANNIIIEDQAVYVSDIAIRNAVTKRIVHVLLPSQKMNNKW